MEVGMNEWIIEVEDADANPMQADFDEFARFNGDFFSSADEAVDYVRVMDGHLRKINGKTIRARFVNAQGNEVCAVCGLEEDAHDLDLGDDLAVEGGIVVGPCLSFEARR
jgi:hypothetical protein